MHDVPRWSRRAFLSLLPVGLLSALGAKPFRTPGTRPLSLAEIAEHCGPATDSSPGARGAYEHPEPRPGIDASNIVADGELMNPSAAPVFEKAREIPEVLDGIRCHCRCADLDGYRSLLSCYEGPAMAQFCDICQGEAQLAHRLHTSGKDLAAIRTSIDARYG